MNQEVELKFAFPPDAAAALLAHPLLQAAESRDLRALRSTYFDTARQDLRKARFICRLRDSGDKRVQTVKGPTADLAIRNEWEAETSGDTPDLQRAPLPAPLRRAVAGKPLTPVFKVDVERQVWLVTHRASRIEIAFDRGRIEAEGRSAEVSEVELEVKDGDVRDAFDLARSLCADLPLELDLHSKAKRGWDLKETASAKASGPPLPVIEPRASFVDGFAALAQACLAAMAAQAPVLRARPDAEALHEMRARVRRMRAVLRVFRRRLRDDAYDEIVDELKRLSRALGAARDLDVAGLELGIEAALAERREASYARVLGALSGARYRRLLVDLADWLSNGAWRRRRGRKDTRSQFADAAALEFHRWDKRIRKAARQFSDLDADERHAVRIRAKSLLSCRQLTAGLVPRGARKAHAASMKALKAFQAALGDVNDARVNEALIADLDSEAGRGALRKAARRNKRGRKKSEDRAHETLVRYLESEAIPGLD